MFLPQPRGPLSGALFPLLLGPPADLPPAAHDLAAPDRRSAHLDDDLQISLFTCYALHYRGFADVDPAWEWHPPLLAVRAMLEQRFERCLRGCVEPPAEIAPDQLPKYLLDLGAPRSGPSLAQHMWQSASLDHFREFAIHRSLYNLMEADPHTWAIPRLPGRAKCALVEIQADEYGNGIPGRLHSELFAKMMAALGLDNCYGRYVEQIPATSLALVNAVSMFGLHGRLRGALVGNLAMSEIGSSHGNRCFSKGLERLAAGGAARLFFDEHVEADAVHEQIAAYDLCGSFVADCPDELPDVLFGAMASRELKRCSNTVMVDCWAQGRSSLRQDPGLR